MYIYAYLNIYIDIDIDIANLATYHVHMISLHISSPKLKKRS